MQMRFNLEWTNPSNAGCPSHDGSTSIPDAETMTVSRWGAARDNRATVGGGNIVGKKVISNVRAKLNGQKTAPIGGATAAAALS
jgi:hypothetical protein